MFKKYTDFLKTDRGRKIIIAVGIAGMALILLSGYLPDNSEPDKEKSSDMLTVEEYQSRLEQQVADLVSCIAGVGEAKVMITLESGIEYVYATQGQKSSDISENSSADSNISSKISDNSSETVILVENGNGGKEALVRTEILPTVKGVVVVCDGGGSSAVADMIKEAVTTALNISERKVCVTKLSK